MWHKCNSTSITLAFLMFCLLFSHEMYLYWLFNAFNFKSISSNYLTLCFYNYYNIGWKVRSEKWLCPKTIKKLCRVQPLCAKSYVTCINLHIINVWNDSLLHTQSFYMLIIVDIITYYTYNSKVISICSYSFTLISFLEKYCKMLVCLFWGFLN